MGVSLREIERGKCGKRNRNKEIGDRRGLSIREQREEGEKEERGAERGNGKRGERKGG